MSEWISVKEGMPTDMQEVLAFDGATMARAWPRPTAWYNTRWGSFDEELEVTAITHWMPMPKPPKEADE